MISVSLKLGNPNGISAIRIRGASALTLEVPFESQPVERIGAVLIGARSLCILSASELPDRGSPFGLQGSVAPRLYVLS